MAQTKIEKNLRPERCYLCGGKVTLIPNKRIYKKPYGSGKMYFCSKCSAYANTRKDRPLDAVGLLANGKLRRKKQECYALLENHWKYLETKEEQRAARAKIFYLMSKKLHIYPTQYEISWLNLEQIEEAIEYLKEKDDGNISKETPQALARK